MNRTHLSIARMLTWTLVGFSLNACSSYKQAGGADPDRLLDQEAAGVVKLFKRTDPGLQRFFDSATGYVVFPNVTKGAAGVGAAHGRGVVYEAGQPIGYANLTQGTIGLQLGGQTYSELVFFQTTRDLTIFKRGETKLSAQASAVAASKGAAANADYAHGVAIFTLGQSGLMFEASVGGQKFTYQPK